MAKPAKVVFCKQCVTVLGYTHKDNPVPTIYCPACFAKLE